MTAPSPRLAGLGNLVVDTENASRFEEISIKVYSLLLNHMVGQLYELLYFPLDNLQ
ncbi:MAG: hypothetical protein KGZ53_10690 [Peptococcaceae bacterium]|nr:hypothetical protein [Peptococcaceae bacterium]